MEKNGQCIEVFVATFFSIVVKISSISLIIASCQKLFVEDCKIIVFGNKANIKPMYNKICLGKFPPKLLRVAAKFFFVVSCRIAQYHSRKIRREQG